MELKLFELQKGFLFRYVKFSVVPKVSHFWSYRTRFLINWFVINKKRIQQHATYLEEDDKCKFKSTKLVS